MLSSASLTSPIPISPAISLHIASRSSTSRSMSSTVAQRRENGSPTAMWPLAMPGLELRRLLDLPLFVAPDVLLNDVSGDRAQQ